MGCCLCIRRATAVPNNDTSEGAGAGMLARPALQCRRAYILPLWFFLFLLYIWHLISEVTELISTKLGHLFIYDCYLKNFVRIPPGIYPHGLGQKTVFGTDVEIVWKYLQWNMVSTIGKKLVNLHGLLYMPPNLVNFGPEMAENGWPVFAHPLHFRFGRHCQPYHMHII